MVEDDDTGEVKSKSQLKRESSAYQKVGERLVELSAAKLASFPLSERLQEAIAEAQRLTSRGALRRQRQYIGKLMRSEDVAAIERVFEQQQHVRHEEVKRFHELETWRNRLIDEGDTALAAFLDRYPGADRTRLRQMIRSVQKERSTGSKKMSRALFHYLSQIVAG